MATDALRILRHELRQRNTNQALKIATRSTEAQRVIDEYSEANVPKNESPDALHADHVYPLTEDQLHRNDTLELWIDTMHRLNRPGRSRLGQSLGGVHSDRTLQSQARPFHWEP